MAIHTTAQYTYQPKNQISTSSFFEVKKVEMETHCVYNQNQIAQHYKIFFIEDGSGTYQVDFKQIHIEKAGLFFLSPGQVFVVDEELMRIAYEISFDKNFYCVEAHGKEIACNGMLFNNVHRATMLNLKREEAAVFKGIIQQMIEELEHPQRAAHQAMLETQLRLFIIEALRAWDKRPTLQENELPLEAEPSRLAAEYIALVEKKFKETHNISDYAEALFVEPKSLSKNLQKAGYPTPKQVLHDRLMLEAKRALRFSEKPVKEIAYELGFDDPAYFSRLFSKNEGLSPNAYRGN